MTKPPLARRARMRKIIERELKACYVTAAAYQADMRIAREELTRGQAIIDALRTLLDAYNRVAPVVSTRNFPLERLSAPFRTEAGINDPVEAAFGQIKAWADNWQVKFSSWDDLPAVNLAREKHNFAPFKRRPESAA